MKRFCLMVLLTMTGCSAGPAQHLYVLRAPEPPTATVAPDGGETELELRRVSVPDFLDTTDILLRDGTNGLRVSPTGRWGERLSVGFAQALRGALVSRLPALRVVQNGSGHAPAWRARVEVEAFDVLPDGRCVLSARWSVLRPDAIPETGFEPVGERSTIVVQASGRDDAAVVAAMTRAIDALADRIATATSEIPRHSRAASAR